MKPMKSMKPMKPTVKLIGQDGNAFAILASCKRVLIEADYKEEDIEMFMTEATSANYDHLLQTVMEWFEVE